MIGITGIEPQRIYVDRGYRGHDYPNKHRVYRSGQKRGVFGVIKKELRRRSVVEPVIGHLKSDGHLGKNYLKGTLGDQQNALLTGAGYNFRLLLKWLRKHFWLHFLSPSIIEKCLYRARLHLYNPTLQTSPAF